MAQNGNYTYGPAPVDAGGSSTTPTGQLDRAPDPVPAGPALGYIPVSTGPVIPQTEQAVSPGGANIVSGPNISAPSQVRYLTILANGVVVANNASTLNFSGSGVTVTKSGSTGANIVITSGGGTDYGNSNVSAFLAAYGSNTISTTGNITGGVFFGDGSQLTGLAGNYGNANVSLFLADFGSNSISTTGNITGDYIFGNVQAADGTGSVQFNRDGVLAAAAGFNYDEDNQALFVKSLNGTGDPVSGTGALYVGIEGFVQLGSTVLGQFTSNVNSYAQVNLQNISTGDLASADYIITADNGTDSSYYLDLGLAGSNHADPDFFGDATSQHDGYLYVTATDQAGPSNGEGNLILGSTNGVIKMFVGNTAQANVIATVTENGLNLNKGLNFVYGYINQPAYGDPIQISSGTNVQIQSNENGYTWEFDNTGNLILPSNDASINYANGVPYGGGGGGNPFNQDLNTTDNVAFQSLATGTITSDGLEIYTESGSDGSIDLYTDWGTTGNGVEVWLQHGDRVSIKTADGTYAWEFDNSGNLTLPGNTFAVNYANGTPVTIGGGGNPFDQDLNTTDDVTFNSVSTGTISNVGTITSDGVEIYTNPGSGGSIDLYTDWTGSGTTGGLDLWLLHGDGIYLKTDDNNYVWKFDNSGNLTLPTNNFTVNYANGTPVNIGGGGNVDLGNITFNGDDIGSTNNVVNITATDYAQLQSTNTYIWVESNNADIEVNGNQWIFDDTGNLVLPSNTASINYANGVPYGGGGGGNPFNQSLNTTDDVTFNSITLGNTPSGASNVIQYGLGNLVGYNDGGWVIGEYNGTDYGTEGVRISPGIEGNVEVNLPSNQTANVNPLSLNNYVGNVVVSTGNNHQWMFDNGGNLTLPNDANIAVSGTTTQINTSANGFLGLNSYGTGGNNIAHIGVSSQDQVVTIGLSDPVSETDYNWTFDINGTLTLAGDINAKPSGFPFSGTITNITTGNPTVVVTVSTSVFPDPVTGQVTIWGVNGTSQANDTWYYQAVNEDQFQLFSDAACTTPVNGTTWTAYTFGGHAYASQFSSLAITTNGLQVVAGGESWAFDNTGQINLPTQSNSFNKGRIQSDNGYPTLLAYGSDPEHGGPELDWMDSDDPSTAFSNSDVLRNTLYLNDTGLYVGMNENHVTGSYSGSFRIANDGTVKLPVTNTDAHGSGSGESAKLTGTRKVVGGLTQFASYSAVINAGGNSTVVYSATSSDVQSVKITFAVQSNGAFFNWEQFDVVAVKNQDSAGDVIFVVSNRVNGNYNVPNTQVDATVNGDGAIEISLNLDPMQTSGGWSSFDAVEFGTMVD